MKLIFLGPPGAGKGTLAFMAVDILKVPHISTGDMFRAAIANKTTLGLKVKEILDSGKLVDDSITIELVKERLAREDAQKGYILDGFPRTIPQAEALEVFSPTEKVINFDLPDSVILERLGGRQVCRGCGFNFHAVAKKTSKAGVCDYCGNEVYVRDDDKPEAVQKRLNVYREQTTPLINFYRQKGLLLDIDSSISGEETLKLFKKVLGI